MQQGSPAGPHGAATLLQPHFQTNRKRGLAEIEPASLPVQADPWPSEPPGKEAIFTIILANYIHLQ